MPRRARRTQPASDVEEDTSSQQLAHSRDEAFDDEPIEEPAPSRRVKASGSKLKTRNSIVAEVSEHSNSDNEVDTIDVENFTDQPWGKEELITLRELAGDWTNVRNTVKNGSGEMFPEIAVGLLDADVDGIHERLQDIDGLMKEVIDIQAEMIAHEQALDSLYQKGLIGEEITDMLERYKATTEGNKDAYTQKTSRKKYAQHDQYIAFQQAIYEAKDVAMPPMTEIISKEDGDESDDEDVEIGGLTQNFNCPISLRPLENPMTSAVCNHSFSGNSLREYFGGSRMAKKCAASGCNRSFTLAQCRPDSDLERRVQAFLKRQKRREENSDAEEIID